MFPVAPVTSIIETPSDRLRVNDFPGRNVNRLVIHCQRHDRGPDGRVRAAPEASVPEFLDLHGKTSKMLRAANEAAMQRHGLHLGQNHLLAVLWDRDGRTPGEIAAAVNVTTPAVVKMAGRMIEAGLISRRRDDRDNRLVRLWLTDTGRALREPVEAERRFIEEKVTENLTGAERDSLLSALWKIYHSAGELLDGPVGDAD
jgi:DNA-binding MarR family transcriptional regulator